MNALVLWNSLLIGAKNWILFLSINYFFKFLNLMILITLFSMFGNVKTMLTRKCTSLIDEQAFVDYIPNVLFLFIIFIIYVYYTN